MTDLFLYKKNQIIRSEYPVFSFVLPFNNSLCLNCNYCHRFIDVSNEQAFEFEYLFKLSVNKAISSDFGQKSNNCNHEPCDNVYKCSEVGCNDTFCNADCYKNSLSFNGHKFICQGKHHKHYKNFINYSKKSSKPDVYYGISVLLAKLLCKHDQNISHFIQALDSFIDNYHVYYNLTDNDAEIQELYSLYIIAMIYDFDIYELKDDNIKSSVISFHQFKMLYEILDFQLITIKLDSPLISILQNIINLPNAQKIKYLEYIKSNKYFLDLLDYAKDLVEPSQSFSNNVDKDGTFQELLVNSNFHYFYFY